VPPLRRADLAEFRRRLVGLSDPGKKLDLLSQHSVREEVIDFLTILPELYQFEDRLPLWERIGKGVATACAAHRHDAADWSDTILPSLDCEGWQAALNERWSAFQMLLPTRPPEWHEAFIRAASRLGTVLPLARARHKERLAANGAAAGAAGKRRKGGGA